MIADSLKFFFGGTSPSFTPIDKIPNPATGQIVAIAGGLPICSDCTSRGGSNVKPDFWP
ncbi:MAG: hypothetical protein WDO19_04210 [Bacteroidota bacterium]